MTPELILGHQYAMSTAAGSVDPVSALTENISGMQYVNFLSTLATQVRMF